MKKTTHERLDKIARKVSRHTFKSLPYTTPDDVYQAAYMGALVASRKPEFRPDDPGAEWWLSRYARQSVAAQELPINKASSACPRAVVDRPQSAHKDLRSYTIPLPAIRSVRNRLLSFAQDRTDQRILLLKLDTDMTMVEIGKEVGLSYEDAWKRFRRIRLWARRQDFMLSTYRDLTGKTYVTKSRSKRNTTEKHCASGDSQSKRDESSATSSST